MDALLKEIVEYISPAKGPRPNPIENAAKAKRAELEFGKRFNRAYELECRAEPGDVEQASDIYDDLFWNDAYTPLHTPTTKPLDFIERMEVIKKTYGDATAHFLLAVNVLRCDVRDDEGQILLTKGAIAHCSMAVLACPEFTPAWDLLLVLAAYNTPENNYSLSRLCAEAESSMLYQEKIHQLLSTAAAQGYQLAIDEMKERHHQSSEFSSS